MQILGIDFSCASESLSDGKFPDKHCLLPLVSKLLGYCIVAASTTVKVPQILKILKHGSVRGLSLVAFELEVVGYTIALAYCLHKGLPFSAYGELVFLLIQGISARNFFLCQGPANMGELYLRVFTSIQEKAPTSGILEFLLLILGSAIGIMTNGTILSQILVYMKPSAKKEKKVE
ncbi:hypothetical protein HHK36_009864 [Tetracentron sinense]|uniref:Mannose-P-dolichol utilization defect 1 protein homolog n=1 Tax=Tetracentron sinense TaxID=13715 RepID=A0A834ZCK1_TETSI|nr:hypothetical protein HHK36_009864 [Tetracentron sinense]